mmetsp:Transcript_26975/g.39448  ORF Transcript_26975/g.39448 Transcript_26975/m.39448 type:complete len:97 (+) Transcript_26975:122-412(+)
MPRVDGSKVVAMVTGVTILAAGLGTIYLPFFIDREKLRGLNEDMDMPLGARHEMDKMLSKMREEHNETNNNNMAPPPQQPRSASMWNYANNRGSKS